MPLPLPAGNIAIPLISGTDQALQGPRVTDYRFELLDQDEHLIGLLETVNGGSVDWVSRTAIHGGGTLDVADPGTVVDWLNVRIRPVIIYARADTPPIQERTLGVFLTAAPVEAWTETGRTWQVELLDKLSILDRDIVTDGNGDPVTYSVDTGANIIDTVRTLIEDTGETTQAILDHAAVLSSPMTWDLGTARLKICNDLLDAGNFTSLWTDAAGQFQARPFVAPEDRAPVYSLLAPFVQGQTSLMAPSWSVDRDIYEVPNRYVAITSGSGDTPALTSVAENLDPNSPFSYANRGRWVTRVLTNAEAADQGALDAIARRGLTATTSVAAVVSVENVYLPDLLMNSTVWFRNTSADLAILCEVNKLTVPFDPLALCKTELLEVLG